MATEEKVVYDELIRQGWSEEDAFLFSRKPKSLQYAQARVSAAVQEMRLTVTRAFIDGQKRMNEAMRRFNEAAAKRLGRK